LEKLKRFEFHAATAVFILVCMAVYVRLFFGVSVGDEANNVAPAYLPMLGGQWFVDEKVIQQVAAMTYAPILWLYGSLFGTDGIMLFNRHLHFFLSLFVALNFYPLLKRFCPPSVALLMSALVIAFVPHAIPSISYNTIGSLLFGLACTWGIRSLFERKRWMAAAAGIVWVVCGFAYPTLIAAFAVFALIAIVLAWKNPEDRRTWLLPMIAGVLVTSIALGGLLLSFGLDNIMSAVEYSKLFNSPGAIWKLAYAFKMVWVYMPPLWAFAVIAAGWAVAAWWSPFYGAIGFLVFVVCYLLFGGEYESMPTQVFFCFFAFFLPYLCLAKRGHLNPEEKRIVLLLIIPALAGAIATCLSSRLTLYVMCLTGIFGSVALITLLVGKQKVVAQVAALILLGATVYHYYGRVYEDDPLSTLDYRIHGGPFGGLITFEEKGKFIEGLQSDLHQLGIEHKTILFKDFFPGGYLMADNRPIGPTMYIAPANFYPEARPVYAQIYSDRKYWPEIVVELAWYPVYRREKWIYAIPDQDPYRDPFREFFQRTGYYDTLVDRGAYRFLKRKY
jgi:hypothetical protein